MFFSVFSFHILLTCFQNSPKIVSHTKWPPKLPRTTRWIDNHRVGCSCCRSAFTKKTYNSDNLFETWRKHTKFSVDSFQDEKQDNQDESLGELKSWGKQRGDPSPPIVFQRFSNVFILVIRVCILETVNIEKVKKADWTFEEKGAQMNVAVDFSFSTTVGL